MRKITQLLALCALSLPLTAQAQDNPNYWAVAWSTGEYEQNTDPAVKLDQNGIRGKFGRFLGPYFAVEGHLGVYEKDDTRVVTDTGVVLANSVGLQIKVMASAFARANVPFANGRGHFYGLAGVTYADADSDDGNIVVFDEAVAAPAFGVGLALFGDEQNGIEIEWIRYMSEGEVDDIEFDLDMWNLGYVRRF
jgi:hypothetical protein